MIRISLNSSFEYRSSGWFLFFIIFFFVLLCSLSVWQFVRGGEKSQQIDQLLWDLEQEPQIYDSSSSQSVLVRMRQIKIIGHYLPWTLLLDNSIFVERDANTSSRACHWLMECGESTGATRVGYRVVTFFRSSQSQTLFAVERGWVPAGENRSVLPSVPPPPTNTLAITGVPVEGRGLRRVLQEKDVKLPEDLLTEGAPHRITRVQQINPNRLQQSVGALDEPVWIYPAVLILHPQSAGILPVTTPLNQLSYLTPQKHYIYSAQWFLMGLILFGLHITVCVRRKPQRFAQSL